jgi:hypothetical protein
VDRAAHGRLGHFLTSTIVDPGTFALASSAAARLFFNIVLPFGRMTNFVLLLPAHLPLLAS